MDNPLAFLFDDAFAYVAEPVAVLPPQPIPPDFGFAVLYNGPHVHLDEYLDSIDAEY